MNGLESDGDDVYEFGQAMCVANVGDGYLAENDGCYWVGEHSEDRPT